jgi:hypothetical protein
MKNRIQQENAEIAENENPLLPLLTPVNSKTNLSGADQTKPRDGQKMQ